MSQGHWPQMGKLWRFVGHPLRPGAQDIAEFESAIAHWQRSHTLPPRALILGVTPELYTLNWPSGSQLHALDASPEMIEALWPGTRTEAMVGSWTAIPVRDNAFDVVVCDGGFGMLRYPDQQTEMLEEVKRVLKPGGIFSIRLFAPVGRTGTLEEILTDLSSGRIVSLDALKLRLWGALHGSPIVGVQPRTVVATIRDAVDNLDQLAHQHGWALPHVRALELHRESLVRYYLTDAAEMVRMACVQDDGFVLRDVVEPEYELGQCCPIVTLERRN